MKRTIMALKENRRRDSERTFSRLSPRGWMRLNLGRKGDLGAGHSTCKGMKAIVLLTHIQPSGC